VLASAATAGVIRVPQDVSCIEAAIQYARAAATAAEEGAGGDMRGDTEGDTFSMTIELDGAQCSK
jgi:hypothetical protein